MRADKGKLSQITPFFKLPCSTLQLHFVDVCLGLALNMQDIHSNHFCNYVVEARSIVNKNGVNLSVKELAFSSKTK